MGPLRVRALSSRRPRPAAKQSRPLEAIAPELKGQGSALSCLSSPKSRVPSDGESLAPRWGPRQASKQRLFPSCTKAFQPFQGDRCPALRSRQAASRWQLDTLYRKALQRGQGKERFKSPPWTPSFRAEPLVRLAGSRAISTSRRAMPCTGPGALQRPLEIHGQRSSPTWTRGSIGCRDPQFGIPEPAGFGKKREAALLETDKVSA